MPLAELGLEGGDAALDLPGGDVVAGVDAQIDQDVRRPDLHGAHLVHPVDESGPPRHADDVLDQVRLRRCPDQEPARLGEQEDGGQRHGPPDRQRRGAVRPEPAQAIGAEDAEIFKRAYDVTPEGNFEGHTILNRLASKSLGSAEEEQRLAGMRAKLLEARGGRIRPGWDDKVLADWNGLAIAAIARAGVVFERAPWVNIAREAFTFITEKMTVDGRLVHATRHGQGRAPATANDYANMIWAALRLYQATGNENDLAQARHWVEVLDTHYWDEDGGGYFTAADDTDDVILRPRHPYTQELRAASPDPDQHFASASGILGGAQ